MAAVGREDEVSRLLAIYSRAPLLCILVLVVSSCILDAAARPAHVISICLSLAVSHRGRRVAQAKTCGPPGRSGWVTRLRWRTVVTGEVLVLTFRTCSGVTTAAAAAAAAAATTNCWRIMRELAPVDCIGSQAAAGIVSAATSRSAANPINCRRMMRVLAPV